MVPVQFYLVFVIFAVLELHRTAETAKTAGTAKMLESEPLELLEPQLKKSPMLLTQVPENEVAGYQSSCYR